MNTCFFLIVLCFAYCSAGGFSRPVLSHAPLVEPAYVDEVYDPRYPYGTELVQEVVDPGYGYGRPLVEKLVAPGYKYGAPLLTAGLGAPIVSKGYRNVAPLFSNAYGGPIVSDGYGAPIMSPGYGAPIMSSGYGAPVVSSGYGAPVVSAPVVEEVLEPVDVLHKHKYVNEEAYDHEHDSAYRFTASDNGDLYTSYFPGASIVAGASYYPASYPHYPKPAFPLVNGYPKY